MNNVVSSIRDIAEKIKGFGQKYSPTIRTIQEDLFLGIIIILVAFGSFGLGRLSKIEGSKIPVRFENLPETTSEEVKPFSSAGGSNTQLVASKNGTKYYYPWCSGVSKISQANLIYFSSKKDAETRGYTPSATCKGL